MAKNARRFLPPRRWLIAFSLFAAVSAFLLGSEWLLDYEPACDQPCAVGQTTDCEPIGLQLELGSPLPKAGKSRALFYRLTITNRSCATLRFPAGRFMWNFGELRSRAGFGYELRIVDPQGNIVRKHKKGVLGSVHFYRDAPRSTAEFRSKKGARLDADQMLDLAPGDSITTAPAILSPFKSTFGHSPPNDWSLGGTDIIEAPATAPPGTPEPPSGFTAEDDLYFPVPGRYTVFAKIDRLPAWAIERRPLARFVPDFVEEILSIFELRPTASGTKSLDITTAPISAPLEVGK